LAAIHEAGGATIVITPITPLAEGGIPRHAITYDGPIDLNGPLNALLIFARH
jgi:hypothetical protein